MAFSMNNAQHKDAHSQSISALSGFRSAALTCGLWILLVGGVHRDEMIVGAFSVSGAMILLRLVAGVRQQEVQFTLRDIVSGWRIPWYAAQDVFVVSLALVRAVLLKRKPHSTYWVCGFKTSKSDPQDIARRILVTGYTSATPNIIILGVDYAQSRMLFHQLVPGKVNETMRQLGAKA